MVGRRRRSDSTRMGRFCISMMGVVFGVVMSVQIVTLYQKDLEYISREESLKQQLADETDRQAEIREYEQYVQSRQYVEDMAKSRLGLLYENEIIFKEQR